MRTSNWAIVISVAIMAVAGWALYSRPQPAQSWNGVVSGFSYSPFRNGEDPLKGDRPNVEQVERDLAFLGEKTRQVRLYSAIGTEDIPKIAFANGLRVMAAAWIDADKEKNAREVDALIDQARRNRNVNRVLVGNEALLRENVTAQELIAYIRQVKRQVRVPVSTAETWHVWLKHPELAREVDYIAVHILPYWEGQSVENSLAFTRERLADLKKAFPTKPIVVSEIGWPSNGRIRKDAVANPLNQATFIRDFLNFAHENKLDYFVIEAFDQPWKRNLEGGVGAYWGVFDADRNEKFAFTGPVQAIENWWLPAGISVLLAMPFGLMLINMLSQLNVVGRFFIAVLVQITSVFLVWSGYTLAIKYLTVQAIAALVLTFPAIALLIAGLVTEAIELAEMLWQNRFNRLVRFGARSEVDPARAPMVSIHLPCHNEPPEMVIETLTALAKMDYPNFEVLVIDNNTKDPAVWKPVEAFCATLGPRFRFFHEEGVKGFKGGALNLVHKFTDPRAEIIGVIDSDYVVEEDWLSRLVPYFKDEKIALVQAPQDYRDADDLFKRMCYWEYKGFFQIGMIQRNERNAIIQHGTMTLVRRSYFDEVDGWSHWCICEDSELGLKLFEKGYEAVYTNRSYGRGLMPDTLAAYKSQRFRWAYGAIQILRRHAKEIFTFGSESKLTLAQRYHFIAGWLPWVTDALNLVICGIAIIWTALVLAFPMYFDYPLTAFMFATLGFFIFKATKSYVLYRTRVGASIAETLLATIAGLGLSYTVARAVIQASHTDDLPFFRTPKMEGKPALMRAFGAARDETILGVLLLGSAIAIAYVRGQWEPEAMVWAALLCVQAVPCFAALLLSLISTLPKPEAPSPAIVTGAEPGTSPAGE